VCQREWRQVYIDRSGSFTEMGFGEGLTLSKQEESDSVKKAALAPGSDMTDLEEGGVLRESNDKKSCVELDKTADE
jgi:hypothetical protein